MLKKVLIGLALVVIVFLIVVALQPNTFAVTRSAIIDAPAPVVFSQVNDFHKWEAWSPWAKMDPAAKSTFSGPEAGEGAKFAWVGNSDVGEGQMTITKSKPAELILIDLAFEKPMKSTCLTEFKFTPKDGQPEQTQVTWTMSGEKGFASKAFCLFMDMDKMVGGDFERGLADMKKAAEAEAKSGGKADEPGASQSADSAQ